MTLKEKILACLRGEKMDALCNRCLAAAIGEAGPSAFRRISTTVRLMGWRDGVWRLKARCTRCRRRRLLTTAWLPRSLR